MSDQTKSDIRTALKVIGTLLVSRGYTNSETVEALCGLALALIGWAWSRSHHNCR